MNRASCASVPKSPAARRTKAAVTWVIRRSGDGPRFKGRGLIQLTGRANYREYGRAIGREAELLAHPEVLETNPDLCVDVAGWFWVRRNLNQLADAGYLTGITTRINGGLNGLDNRRRLLKRARR